jgi:hypothetical protein
VKQSARRRLLANSMEVFGLVLKTLLPGEVL